MRFGIKTMDDFDVKGKTVLLRVDINQPVDKSTDTLKDTTRVAACIPTIRELQGKGAKLVLLAHQGSDIEYKNFYTTAPHAKVLSEMLDSPVQFIDDVCGPAARQAIAALGEGEVLLLDNVRFVAEEQTLFELKLQLSHEEQAQTLLVRKLAPLGDIYICDAFAAAHRDQPSLCGFEQLLPSGMGRLFEEEYCAISEVMENPQRPCVFVLGGAKIGDAFMMMKTVLGRGVADKVLTGGLVAEVLAWAKGDDIGPMARDYITKQGYADLVKSAKELWDAYSDKLVLPLDYAYVENGKRCEANVGSIPADALVLDIGGKTAAEYQRVIREAKTVFVNGPLGVFEEELTEAGTRAVWEALGDTEAYTVLGGGDSIAATKKYGKQKQVDYICTGGGALIRFLSGEELPVVKALRHGAAL